MPRQRKGRSALVDLTNTTVERQPLGLKAIRTRSEETACVPTTELDTGQRISPHVVSGPLDKILPSGVRCSFEAYISTAATNNVSVYSRRRRINNAKTALEGLQVTSDSATVASDSAVIPPSVDGDQATSPPVPEISRSWMFADAPRSRFSVGVGRSLSYRRSSICSFRDDQPWFPQEDDARASLRGQDRQSLGSSSVSDCFDGSIDGDDDSKCARSRQSASCWLAPANKSGKKWASGKRMGQLRSGCPGAPPSSPSCDSPVARGPSRGAVACLDPAFISEKTAYFAEVDAFVLEESTPSPASSRPSTSRCRISQSPAGIELWPLMTLSLGMESLLPAQDEGEEEDGTSMPVAMELRPVRGSRKLSQACTQNLPSVTEHEGEHLQEMGTPPGSPATGSESGQVTTTSSSLLGSSSCYGSALSRQAGQHRGSLTSTMDMPAFTPYSSPVAPGRTTSTCHLSGWSHLSPVSGTVPRARLMPSPMDGTLVSPDHGVQVGLEQAVERRSSATMMLVGLPCGLQGEQRHESDLRTYSHGGGAEHTVTAGVHAANRHSSDACSQALSPRLRFSSGLCQRSSGGGRGGPLPALDDVIGQLEEIQLVAVGEGELSAHGADLTHTWEGASARREEACAPREVDGTTRALPVADDGTGAQDVPARPHGTEKCAPGDLCTALEELHLGAVAGVASRCEEELDDMMALLRECQQEGQQTLGECVESYVGDKPVTKIGEGTYGEAFSGNGVIFKIVPFAGSSLVNGEQQKAVGEILEEVRMTNILSDLRAPAATAKGDGEQVGGAAGWGRDTAAVRGPRLHATSNFIETYGVKVCTGPYPPRLVCAWDDWDKAHISENERVDVFGDDQLFVVFLFANGGADLERFELRDYQEVQSLLLQVTASLAVAEAACGFEHRDLHWGNVLLARTESNDKDGMDGLLRYRLHGQEMVMHTHGVRVSLIDFTLSRLETDSGRVLFCDLSADPEIFKGKRGDPQAETYRHMKKLTKGNWSGRFPKTNCMWLHYLADVVLTQKKFVCTPDETRSLRLLRKSVLQYNSAEGLLKDDFFSGLQVRSVDCM